MKTKKTQTFAKSTLNLIKKQSRQRYTIREKLSILQKVDEGSETLNSIRKEFGIPESTISLWRKDKTKLMEALSGNEAISPERKSLQSPSFPLLEKILFTWIVQNREKDLIITSDIIRTKASLIYKQLKDDCGNVFSEFKASSGWCNNFKKRYNLKNLSLNGEKASADFESFEKFKASFYCFQNNFFLIKNVSLFLGRLE
jgi:transposase-like protein